MCGIVGTWLETRLLFPWLQTYTFKSNQKNHLVLQSIEKFVHHFGTGNYSGW